MKNYTIIYTDSGETFPLAFTSCAKDKDGALRAFRLNKGHVAQVMAIVKLPAKAPRYLNKKLF